MKINKYLVLSLFLISLAAFTAASQISQSNSISVEQTQDCATTYYKVTENVFENITRERNVHGNCLFYYNSTLCLNTTGSNTDCSPHQIIFNFSCVTGTENYQSNEVTGTNVVTRNTTNCSPKSFIVSVNNQRKEIDFSSWGACIQSNENSCIAVICGSNKGGGAVNGVFNGCDGGKSCEKFLFCQDRTEVYYKASGKGFVPYDPTFHLSPLSYMEVGQ